MQNVTPLRYPGGKAPLRDVLRQIIELNHHGVARYLEPFAGGAGAALDLLFRECVTSISLNDLDWPIYCFWRSVLGNTRRLLQLVDGTPVTVEEWELQRQIYQNPRSHSMLRCGFAAFYLNRSNRSGIIRNAGPIGGKGQEGKWRIDARFNKQELKARISRIAEYRDRISVSNEDALTLLKRQQRSNRLHDTFVFLDPPYYRKGALLYLNALSEEYHGRLARFLTKDATFPWVMTYDDVPEIRRLYRHCSIRSFSLRYTARERGLGRELLIFPKGTRLPSAQRSRSIRWN